MLTKQLFNNILFTFHIYVIFPAFFLQLTSSFIPLWSEKILELIYILLNLLRIALWPDTWCILENDPCILERNVSDAFGWNVLYKSVKFIWSNFHLWPLFSCWFFCLDNLPIHVSGMLMSPTIAMLISISPFCSVNNYFICFFSYIMCIYINNYHFLIWIVPFIII